MPELKICTHCVLDNIEVPDIVFDENGVCNYCLEYKAGAGKRRAEKSNLPWIYNKMRIDGTGKKYDCLIGLSGGVDSSLCLHYLVENGIRPMCFSVDNGWNTKEADENIMRLVETLKVPFYRYTLNFDRFRELQMAFMKAGVKNLEIPTDHVLMAASYEMANWYGIKNIVSGGNHATESIMPESYGYNARDLTHIKAIYRKFNGKGLRGIPLLSLLGYIKNRFIKGITVTNLLDYYDYNREAAIKILKDKYGYKPYGQKHEESVFTSWFQNFYLPTKWKLDKRKPHFSSLINSGQMKRSEAIALLRERPIYPELGFETKVMKYLRKDHMEYPNAKWAWDSLSKVYGLLKGRG